MLKEKSMYIKIPDGGYYQRTEVIDNRTIKITYIQTFETPAQKGIELSSLPGFLCLDVEPHTINQDLFSNYQGTYSDTFSFELIKEALNEFNNDPEKYAKSFHVFIPNSFPKIYRIGYSKTYLNDFEAQAEIDFGGHIANWVELGLIFAQIISSTGSFTPVFGFPDKLGTHYKLFIWKNGNARMCGECKYVNTGHCLAYIHEDEYANGDSISLAKPFIIVY